MTDNENTLAHDSKFRATKMEQQPTIATLNDTVFRDFRVSKNNSPKSRLRNIYNSNGSPDRSRMNISKIEENIASRSNSVAIIINGANAVRKIVHPPAIIKERSGSVNNLVDKRIRASHAIYGGGSSGNSSVNSSQNLSFMRKKILDNSSAFGRNFSVKHRIMRPFFDSRDGKENTHDTINITVPKYTPTDNENAYTPNPNKSLNTVKFSDIAQGYASNGSQAQDRPGTAFQEVRPGTAAVKQVSAIKLKKLVEGSSSQGFKNFDSKQFEKKVKLSQNEIELIDNFVRPTPEVKEQKQENMIPPKVIKNKNLMISQRYSSTGRNPIRF